MSDRFEKLVRELAENTRFVRIDMIPFFKEFIKKHRTPLIKIRKSYKISRSRSKSAIIKSNVATYLLTKGEDLFNDWLNLMFAFRKTNLKINIKAGGTSMDVIINISYMYNKNEIEFIKRIIKEYSLKESSIEDISILLLSESVLSIQEIFNEIIGYKFSLMMQNDSIKISDENMQVEIEVVSRLYS
ncbi:MAG: hypothetical protein ACTSPY_05320 [Candidatus Helarchaeota archaeon]